MKWKVFAQRSLQSSAWMLQSLSRGWDFCVHVLPTWKLWLKALILQSALLARNRFRPRSCSRLRWLGARRLCRAWQWASPADWTTQWGPSLPHSACYHCKSTYAVFFFFFSLHRKGSKFSHLMSYSGLWGRRGHFLLGNAIQSSLVQNTLTGMLHC